MLSRKGVCVRKKIKIRKRKKKILGRKPIDSCNTKIINDEKYD